MALVAEALDAELDQETPVWLMRSGREDCGRRWSVVQRIYSELTDRELPTTMPPREWRQVDAILRRAGHPPRILEFDETQHFNHFRASTLRLYPRTAKVAFSRTLWIERATGKVRLEGGSFAKPRPPLFYGENYRYTTGPPRESRRGGPLGRVPAKRA